MNKVLKYSNMHFEVLTSKPLVINIPISYLWFLVSCSSVKYWRTRQKEYKVNNLHSIKKSVYINKKPYEIHSKPRSTSLKRFTDKNKQEYQDSRILNLTSNNQWFLYRILSNSWSTHSKPQWYHRLATVHSNAVRNTHLTQFTIKKTEKGWSIMHVYCIKTSLED